jgi:hypothetical protein
MAIEYLLVTGFQLALITILAGYGFMLYFDTVKNTQMTNSIDSLVEGANRAYSLGPGNVLVVQITLPDGTTASSVGSPTPRYFDFDISGMDLQGIVNPNLSGTLPTGPGTYNIRMENRDSNIILSVV